MLPLAEEIQKAIPESLQPWFADDSSSGGKAIHNEACLNYLLEHGTRYGYFPSPSKSWYICKEVDELAAIEAFQQFKLPIKMTRGHAYLGGFIGNATTKDEWLNKKITTWTAADETLSKMSTQSRYEEGVGFGEALFDADNAFN